MAYACVVNTRSQGNVRSGLDAGARADEVAPDTPPTDYSLQLSRLAAIVESSDDAIVSKTLEGTILSWNAGATRIFGYQPDEVIGKPITIIIPPELHTEETRILTQVRSGRRIDHFDTERVTKDGRRIHISLTVSPVRDAQGRIVGASKVARDVTDRKRAEQALRNSEQLLAAEAQALSELSNLSTQLWRAPSLAEGLQELLAAVVKLLGADMGHVQLLSPDGAVLSLAVQQGFQPDFVEFFRELPASGESVSVWPLTSGQRLVIENVESEPSYESLRAVARVAGYRALMTTRLVAPDGAPLGLVSTHFRAPHRPTAQQLQRLDPYLRQASDFIRRFRLEETLQHSEQALREADRRKDEFLALLAHELRNPLAPIRYALAANRKPGRTHEQQRRSEEIVERQVAHMSRLLDDLLDISRITRGTLELKRTRTELSAVIAAAVETARPLIDTKAHRLTLDLPATTIWLDADAVRLAQVFANLLINAAKYTEAGGHIQLHARWERREVVVSVRDNGIGIPAEAMSRLFTLFSQAHSAHGRWEEGLGVGLALVRGLVELHGGTVEARSEGEGRGSEFVVRLAQGLPAGDTPQVPAGMAKAKRTGRRVLVVDDSHDAAETCAMLLKLSGHETATAASGHEALASAVRFQPDVLLLDIGLPDVDGYQLARRVRETSWGRDVLLIAVTGWGQEEDKRRALAAGFDHHLTKPVSGEALEALLRTPKTAGVSEEALE
jgi:PAS domain S-box-containing protein